MDTLSATPPQPVAVEQPCIRCGYSLRGLLASGLCPECATPIDRSLRGDLLIFSDPAYIRQVVTGVRMILGSILLMVVVLVAIFALAMAKVPGAEAFGFVALAVTALFLLGWWKVTSPDPGQLTTNKGEKPRQVARVSLLVVAAFQLLELAVRVTAVLPASVATVIGIANSVAMGVGFFSGMLYIRWLTPRIPSTSLHKRALVLMIFIAILFVLQIALSVISSLVLTPMTPAMAASPSGPATVLLIAGGVIGIGDLIALVLYYNLFAAMRKELLVVQTQQHPLETPS